MTEWSLAENAAALLAACRAKGLKIATAESCTGGLIAGALTDIAGSSDVFDRGFVTYSYGAKTDLLGVSAELLKKRGAVNEETARAMVEGALKNSAADIAVAVTGIAGPTGGTPRKPVGLVHFAAIRKGGEILHRREIFPGDRLAVRRATVATALAMLRALV